MFVAPILLGLQPRQPCQASIDACRNIVSYRGSCSPMVMKPTTKAGVQEECIVMELLKGGE